MMQTLEVSRELHEAISSVEKLLNGENGEDILTAIRRYKALKGLDKQKHC